MKGFPNGAQLSRGVVFLEIEAERADEVVELVAKQVGATVAYLEEGYRYQDRYNSPEPEREPVVLVIEGGAIERDVAAFATLVSEARSLKITPVVRVGDPLVLPVDALDAIFGNIPNFLIGPVGDSVKAMLEERLGTVSVPETETEAVLVYSDENWQRQETVVEWEDKVER